MSPMLIIGALLVIIVAILISVYNNLARWRNRSAEAWSDINVQLKRRHDLIPNLVATVKGYAAHEQGTLDKVVNARNQAMQATGGDLKQQAVAENVLSGTLKSLFALSEAYPDLKANQNFLELQRELTDTEDKIQAARRFYNTAVLAYNNHMDLFPGNLVAPLFGFVSKTFFALDDEDDKQPIEVKF